MDSVFIYWDNPDIFYAGQRIAEESATTPKEHYKFRINFSNMLRLAHADRLVQKASAAGSVPPSLQNLWHRLDDSGVEVGIFGPGGPEFVAHQGYSLYLRQRMLEDAMDYTDTPGVAVLLSGGAVFQPTLERMHNRGWRIEILSWAHACNQRMRQWAQENGAFIALDDFYDSVTFLEPSRPGHRLAESRDPAPLDLSLRMTA